MAQSHPRKLLILGDRVHLRLERCQIARQRRDPRVNGCAASQGYRLQDRGGVGGCSLRVKPTDRPAQGLSAGSSMG
jgi:hypothetical protein